MSNETCGVKDRDRGAHRFDSHCEGDSPTHELGVVSQKIRNPKKRFYRGFRHVRAEHLSDERRNECSMGGTSCCIAERKYEQTLPALHDMVASRSTMSTCLSPQRSHCCYCFSYYGMASLSQRLSPLRFRLRTASWNPRRMSLRE